MIRILLLSLLLVGPLVASGASRLTAQTPSAAAPDPTPPLEVADEFQRGFQSMAWQGLAQRMHPDALAYLRLAVDLVMERDTTGWALATLGGGAADRAAFAARDDARVFVDAMTWVQQNAPGLLSSLVSRRSAMIGVVAEGSDTAHVVYRIVTLAQGAEPAVLVLSLARTERGWKVREAPDIDVLHTALRGIPIPRNAPGARPESPEPMNPR